MHASAFDWKRVRALFDKYCDLPPGQWHAALQASGADPATVAQALTLLSAQGEDVQPLDALLDANAGGLAPGQRLGPWCLQEKIGAGGMGIVFRAERIDGAYRQSVAIKVLHHLATEQEVQRLQSERQILANLQLPGMARLYDGGVTDGRQHWLAMELVDGLPLDVHCREQALSLRQRLALFLTVCQVVQAAHGRLILHCDLKPDNILVRADGSPVLLDFGLAQAVGEGGEAQQRFYTPRYASPAYKAGESASVTDDVFSLGVILEDLLTDAPPTGQRLAASEVRHIVARATAAEASVRYNSVEALAGDIRNCLHHRPVQAHPDAWLYRLRKALQHNWRAVAVAAGVSGVAVLGMANIVQARWQAEQEAQIANRVSRFLVQTFEQADPIKRDASGGAQPDARQLLDNAAARIDSELMHAPVQRARMQEVLGEAYLNIGVIPSARLHLQQALATLQGLPGNTQVDQGRVTGLLARLETASGNHAEGAALAEKALALAGPHASPAVLARLHDARALALVSLQAFDRAEPHFRRAIALHQQADGDHASLDALRVRYHLGYMQAQWGRYQAAETEFRHILEQTRQRAPALDMAVTTRLGQTLRWQGRHAEALPLLQQALAQAQAIHGNDSSALILQHDALADLLSETGDYDQAEHHFAERLRLSAANNGTDSVAHSMGLLNLGVMRARRGQTDSAEALMRRAIDIRSRRLGPVAPATLRGHNELALLLMRGGDHDAARELLQQAEAGLAGQLPADAPGRVEAGLALVQLDLAQGHTADAARRLAQMQEHLGQQGRLARQAGELLAQLARQQQGAATGQDAVAQVHPAFHAHGPAP